VTVPLRLATAAMGTRFELVILEGRGGLQAAGEAAIDEIEEWHRRLNRFSADSLLSHVNRTAATERVKLDRDTFALLADAMAVWDASGGAFDITVAPALAALGCAESAVAGTRVLGRGVALRAEDWTIGFAEPGLSLDFGGIAKGHALECAAASLRTNGVSAALLHGGTSSVLAIGAPPGSTGWRVAIGAGRQAPTVDLCDEALSVSDSQGQAALGTAAHIVDPRTGRPVEGAGLVAVRGPSARIADAWSTALVVLGHVPGTFPGSYRALFATGPSAGTPEFLPRS
jgi:thiamine biosynthesis lipoprotein